MIGMVRVYAQRRATRDRFTRTASTEKKASLPVLAGRLDKIGGVLLSHRVAPAVPSALWGLTSVFGMGTGVTPTLWPPKLVN
jgi:hypothetical protein